MITVMKQNKAIILIPHYNNPKGLYTSLLSVGQDENIDVVIVDDGSKTLFNEQTCIDSFKANGSVFFKYLPENKGIEVAMNIGLTLSKEKSYTYIARLDCGDINKKERFKKQEKFLEQHPDVLLIGSHSNYIDMNGKTLFTQRNTLNPMAIKNELFLNATFVHPTIMFHIDIFKYIDGYPLNYPSAEDYALYMALNAEGIKMANIDEVLLDTEANPKGISAQRRKVQLQSRLKLIRKYFYFGYYPIIGLIRNYIIYITPTSLLLQIKKLIRK